MRPRDTKKYRGKDSLFYDVLDVPFGSFGYVWDGEKLLKTGISTQKKAILEAKLLVGMENVKPVRGQLADLTRDIGDYFEGKEVDFGHYFLDMGSMSDFTKKVLCKLRSVKFGDIITYGQLAADAGSAGACRAVGNVMARNRFPLVVPCHRVINSDGGTGNYLQGDPNGRELKVKLLKHESE